MHNDGTSEVIMSTRAESEITHQSKIPETDFSHKFDSRLHFPLFISCGHRTRNSLLTITTLSLKQSVYLLR